MNKKLVFFLAGAFFMTGCFHNDDDDVAGGITSVYPDPADLEEFVDANKAAASADPETCSNAICTDYATDDLSVHQNSPQNDDNFAVQGVQFLPLFGSRHFRTVLYWTRDASGDTSSFLELEDEHTLEFYGNDYYYVKEEEEGEETNEVFIYSLSGDVDESSTEDDTDWLYGGMWLHTPDGGVPEVIAFADAFGEPITEGEIKALGDVTATYGAVDDETPEASGYYVNEDGEASTFFADAVLEVDLTGDYGNIVGTISNDGDYHGPEFTLNLATASSADGSGGLYTGTTAGASGGELIDNTWEGLWGAKFFGLDGTNAPDFVYGTFGAEDGSSGNAEASILGFFLAQKE